MSDRTNWERERMHERGREGARDNWGGGREEWRDDWDREREERNRPWGREGRSDFNESRQGYEPVRGGYGRGEGRWNEGRDYGSEYGDPRGYGGTQRGDYGPGEFTRQFRGSGPEYYGTGQRGFGTTWGGTGGGYTGFGGGGYTGGLGEYGERGRYAGRGPKGYQRSDDRIREDVCERLTRHPEIDAGEIEIQVKNGEVTLTGTVDRREEKRMAEDVAESVSGVRDVHNQLRAQPQGAATHAGQSNRETTPSKNR